MRKLSIVSLIFVLVGIVLSYFRESLFLVKVGYAASEIKFTVFYMFPIIMVSFFTSIYVYYKILIKKYPEKQNRTVTIYIATPGLILGILYLAIILMLSM